MKKLVTLLSITGILLVACDNESQEEIVETTENINTDDIEVIEETNQQEIKEIDFVPFEENEKAQEIADGAILGDDTDIQASFATMYLNNSFNGMFEFKENNKEKIIVGHPVSKELEERIEVFKNGDIETKQSFYDVFSEIDFQFLGVLHGIDDDYEIQILDEQESENKLIIFNKDGYLHNSFAN